MRFSTFRCVLHLLFALATQLASAQTATLNPVAHFLSKEQSAILLAGPAAQSYFDAMGGAELSAKTRVDLGAMPLADARTRARQLYSSETLDFSSDEQAVLRWALDGLMPVLAAKAPRYARSEWKFAKVSASIEGGLPHTRSDAIVLSASFLQTLISPFRDGDRKGLASFLHYILVHEQTHVLQRAEPELFDQLAIHVFGFERTEAPTDPWLLERRVTNPDAMVHEWVYPLSTAPKTGVIPYLVFSDVKNPQMPQHLQAIAVMATYDSGGWRVSLVDDQPQVTPLKDAKTYLAAFPNKNQLYHPYEIAADLLGYWLAGQSHGEANHPLRAAVTTWAAQHLQ